MPASGGQSSRAAPSSAARPHRANARPYRILDVAQPHNTNNLDGALLFALRILGGDMTTWLRLRQAGSTDAELAQAIDGYFPVFLGYHTARQKGFYIGRGPEPFFIWGSESGTGGRLVGPALLKKVRAVLCLPERPQKS